MALHTYTHTQTLGFQQNLLVQCRCNFFGGKKDIFSVCSWLDPQIQNLWMGKANDVCKGEVLSSSQTPQYSSLCSPGPCLFRSSLIVRNPGRHHSCLLAVTCFPPAFFCGNRTVRGAVPCGHPAPLAREPELSLSP